MRIKEGESVLLPSAASHRFLMVIDCLDEAVTLEKEGGTLIRLSVDEGLTRNEEAREVLWMLPESPAREALTEMTYRLDEMLRECCVD